MQANRPAGVLVLEKPVFASKVQTLVPTRRPHRILIADDDPESRVIFKLYLEHIGMQVYTTPNVDMVLGLVRFGWPDLIVCEWALRQLESGRLILDVLDEAKPTSRVPRIVVTSRLLPAAVIDELRGRCANLISKPVALRVLATAIGAVAERSQATPIDTPPVTAQAASR